MQEMPTVDLGHWQVLQYVVSFLVAATWLIGVLHAFRSKDRSQPRQSQQSGTRWHEQFWFFDGPIKAAMESVNDMQRTVTEMRADVDNALRDFAHRHEEEVAVLRDVKSAIDLLRETLRSGPRGSR